MTAWTVEEKNGEKREEEEGREDEEEGWEKNGCLEECIMVNVIIRTLRLVFAYILPWENWLRNTPLSIKYKPSSIWLYEKTCWCI